MPHRLHDDHAQCRVCEQQEDGILEALAFVAVVRGFDAVLTDDGSQIVPGDAEIRSRPHPHAVLLALPLPPC
jgi:hypothetical protein